ncbi:MAG: helix-turn-helix domain-containing protein [Bacteroidota bacterium]
MNNQETLYSVSQIAALLGINSASIDRWVESGKLKCIYMQDGKKYFSIIHLSDFAQQYNVSMKFLDKETNSLSIGSMMRTKVSAVK